MKQRIGHIVALPPGVGKTRIVLGLVHKITGSWQKALQRMVILGPSLRLERIWLRELALLVKRPKGEEESEIRFATGRKLKKVLAEEDIKIPRLWFRTYRQIKATRNIRPRPFIIFDEWHRFSIADFCERFIKQPKSNRLLLSQTAPGKYGSHSFFVSATPLNPVLEEKVNDLVKEEAPREDSEVITEARHKALNLLMGLTGQRMPEILSLPFSIALRKLGIRSRAYGNNWKPPKFRWRSGLGQPDHRLLEILQEEGFYNENDWKSHEAAWAIGLVCTRQRRVNGKRRFKVCTNTAGKSKKSFGFNYNRTYIPKNGYGPTDAGKWLVQSHPRVRRLLEILEAEKVISPTSSTAKGISRWKQVSKKKILIFCVHQGVAQGLYYTLRQVIDCPDKFGGGRSFGSTLHEFDDIVDKFNRPGKPPFILVTTDKLSESVDLHHACKTLVHYELPWSPLRIFQRVGRLTRRLPTRFKRRMRQRFNDVCVYHVIIPGSVEEERVNRLIRRTKLLSDEGAWPKELFGGKDYLKIAKALIGKGPSLHLAEEVRT